MQDKNIATAPPIAPMYQQLESILNIPGTISAVIAVYGIKLMNLPNLFPNLILSTIKEGTTLGL